MTEFHFLRPALGIAIAIISFIIFITLRKNSNRKGKHQWHGLIAPHLRQFMVKGADNSTQANNKNRDLLIASIFLLIAIAASGPTITQKPVPAIQSTPQVMIVLDQSLSMMANDIQPNRHRRAIFQLQDLLNALPATQVGLISYAGTAHTLAPISADHDIILNILQYLSPEIMPNQGNNPIEAIDRAIESLSRIGGGGLIWITDEVEPGDVDTLTRKLKDSAVQNLLILGVGTAKGAPIQLSDGQLLRSNNKVVVPQLDPAPLKKIASKASGIYLNSADLLGHEQEFLQTLRSTVEKDQPAIDGFYDEWEDLGPWFLIPTALLFAGLFRQGWLACIPFLLLSFAATPQNGYAAQDVPEKEISVSKDSFNAWHKWFQRPDQKLWHDLKYGKPLEAEVLKQSRDPQAALFKAYQAFQNQDFEAAAMASVKAIDQLPTDDPQWPSAQYNLATSLAHMGQVKAAIQAYEDLLQQGEHKDGAYNLELLQKLLQQQKDQQPPKDKDKQEPKDANEEQQSQGDQSGGDDSKGKENQDNQSDNKQSDNKQSQDGQPKNSQSKDSQSEQAQDGQAPKGQVQEGEDTKPQDIAPAEQKKLTQAEQEEKAAQKQQRAQNAQAFQDSLEALREKNRAKNAAQKAQAQAEQKAQTTPKPDAKGQDKPQTDAQEEQPSAPSIALDAEKTNQELDPYLQQIPEHPGQILRNKMLFESQQRRQAEQMNAVDQLFRGMPQGPDSNEKNW